MSRRRNKKENISLDDKLANVIAKIRVTETRYRTQSCFFVLISASQILFSFVAFLLDVPVLLSYERNPLPVSVRDFCRCPN